MFETDGSTTQAELMSLNAPMSYVAGDGYQAVANVDQMAAANIHKGRMPTAGITPE